MWLHRLSPLFLALFQVVYLPDDVGASLEKYKATLGHTINHSNLKYNCRLIDQFHPRVGIVPAVYTLEEVKANQDVVCHYEVPFELGSPWYQELW